MEAGELRLKMHLIHYHPRYRMADQECCYNTGMLAWAIRSPYAGGRGSGWAVSLLKSGIVP
jgi:hypothetical protein